MYNLSNWKDQFLTEHVQSQNVKGTDFLSSETVVLVSGPPSLGGTVVTSSLVPIGLVQNVSVQQQKQLQQIFEVGSRKPFFIPGRTMISAGLARILFDGPSLMNALYISSAGASGTTLPAYGREGVAAGDTEVPTSPANFTASSGVDAVDDVATNVTGTGDPGLFFINLASGFFNRALGLGFVLYDGEMQAYGGFYLEGCYIQSHQFNVSSQQTVLVENVSIRATAIRPLSTEQISGSTAP